MQFTTSISKRPQNWILFHSLVRGRCSSFTPLQFLSCSAKRPIRLCGFPKLSHGYQRQLLKPLSELRLVPAQMEPVPLLGKSKNWQLPLSLLQGTGEGSNKNTDAVSCLSSQFFLLIIVLQDFCYKRYASSYTGHKTPLPRVALKRGSVLSLKTAVAFYFRLPRVSKAACCHFFVWF